MSDLISRQAAIDAFQNLAYNDWNQGVSTSWADAFTECAEIISGLPSAQPESSQCWGCNCPKMQKTFSEMVHLHDAEGGGEALNRPKTNADRIRAMTDEGLAEFFVAIQNDVADYYDGGHAFEPDFPTHKDAWLGWLKAEDGCE